MTVLGGAVVIAPFAARAQHKPIPVVGWLHAGSLIPGAPTPALDAFRLGLGETGYVDGQNISIEYRWAEGHYDRLPALAADLVSRKVDVIVSATGTQTAMAAKNATSTIPIVFVGVGDPVGMGFVASFSRPGGNITGFSNLMGGMAPKVLELLSELVPRASTIAVLINPNNPGNRAPSAVVSELARTKGVRLTVLRAGTESEIDAAFAALPELHADALLIVSDFVFNTRLQQIVGLTSRYAIPAIFPNRDFAVAGGLISYGPNYDADYRPLGVYVGRILKGEKPADLPVQQPTIFELVINLKTAKALGVTVPQSILAFADEVIE
jgi:putative tryptophan/tyrosine transport system substrate-binding protein